MSSMSFDFLEEMAKMRREIDRVLDEDRLSSWTFPFSRISFLPGRASRAYPLMNISDEVDQSKISAESKNGVLTITLPKAEKSKPKQIKVKIG